MIFGAHVILFSTDAAADRDFFANVLGLSSVDAGGGWPIFALPPSELAVHPADENGRHELFFMSDDLDTEIARLEEKGIHCADVHQERWGRVTHMTLPGGSDVCLYQPSLPSPVTPEGR
jgi:catechol 2,3-dioxygenase-like lactoylglutathione lyase family enzyme